MALNCTSKGAEAVLIDVNEFDTGSIDAYDAFAFGCPAMGAEVLEEGVFDPAFTAIENSLGSKKVGLFGSYGWGDGTWMREWEERCKNDGINLVGEGVICMEAPDGDAIAACNALGASVAE